MSRVFATASRSRRSNLTNVVVRQAMRTGSASPCVIKVHVFDILSVVQASGQSTFPEPLCTIPGAKPHRTFQNVCSYYEVRLVVHYDW